MKKAQLIPIFFLILILGLSIVAYVFYNVYYGSTYERFLHRINVIDIGRNVVESLKSYLMLSLHYSMLQSLREHACRGGTIEVEDSKPIVAAWICNGPFPVNPELSKECLGKHTLYYFNIYFELWNTSLPFSVMKNRVSNCEIKASVDEIFSGKYDEGHFSVNCSPTSLGLAGENIYLSEQFSPYDIPTKVRYWYMFRKFYEWAQQDPFSPCICSVIGCACASSGMESCSSCNVPVENCAKKALKELQSKFDEFVECEYRRICCVQDIGPSCQPPSPCLSWENPMCSKKCEHSCTLYTYGKICPVKSGTGRNVEVGYGNIISQKYESRTFTGENEKEINNKNCVCEYWYESRLAAAYEFTCRDYKYFIPSENGPIPLTFSVTAYAYWRDQDACIQQNLCDCEGKEKCEECTPVNCCTKCREIK